MCNVDSVQNSLGFDDLGRADFPAGKQIGPDCQVGFQEDSVCIKKCIPNQLWYFNFLGVSLTHFYIMEKLKIPD